MGSYNSFYVNVNTQDPAVIKEITANPSNDYDHWASHVFRKWLKNTKWDAFETVERVSKKFPDLIFTVSFYGECGYGKFFVSNGQTIEEHEVFRIPAFPSKSLLKKRLAEMNKRAEKAEIAREKERAEKITAEKEAKISQLESELQSLKAS